MTDLTPQQLEFIESGPAVAMATVGDDGVAKVVRMGIGVLDGQLVATATEDRKRTERLRTDPRATLYFNDSRFKFLTVEVGVEVVGGDEGVDGSERLVRHWQGTPDGPVTWFGETLGPDAFHQRLVDEGRVLYRFDVRKAYGLIDAPA